MTRINIRRERFAQAYVECGDAKRAAIEAGYQPKSAQQRGYRLLGEPAVRERIREHLAASRAVSLVTIDSISRRYDAVYRAAMEDDRLDVALDAIAGQARLHGLIDSGHRYSAGLGSPPPPLLVEHIIVDAPPRTEDGALIEHESGGEN